MNITAITEEILGGEWSRYDSGARALTFTNPAKDDRVISFPDLSVPTTKDVWSPEISHITLPEAIFILVDPDNTYADNLVTPPRVTFEFSIADDNSGTNEAIALVVNVRREMPLMLDVSDIRSAIDQATENRKFYKIRGRSNMASGYGTIRARCLVR